MKRKIVLTKMEKIIQESSLKPNEHIVMKYWKVSYYRLAPTEHPRGEMQRYREVIDGINSTRQNEPEEIVISFKNTKHFLLFKNIRQVFLSVYHHFKNGSQIL